MSSANACPQCGYLMDAFDTQCPRCGGKGLPPAQAPALPASTSQNSPLGAAPGVAPAPDAPGLGAGGSMAVGQVRYCTSCRNRISTSDTRCPHCGQVTPYAATKQRFSLEAQRRGVGYGLCGLLALGAVGAGWGWMNYGGRIKHAMVGQSDIRYTVETRLATEGSLSTQPYSLSTYWFKHGAMRVDTQMLQGPLRRTLSTIALCPQKKLYTLDEALGIYTAEPLPPHFQVEDADTVGSLSNQQASTDGASTERASSEGAWCCQDLSRPLLKRPASHKPGKPLYRLAQYDPAAPAPVGAGAGMGVGAGARIGKVTRSYTIEELGQDTIADVPSVHYRLTVRVKSTGCAGTSEKTEKTEVWVAPSIYNKFSCASPTPTPKPTPISTSTPAPGAATTASPVPPTPVPPTPVPPTPVPLPTPYVVPTPIVVSTPSPAPRATPATEDSCGISYEQEGNVADFGQAFRGLVMRLRVYEGSRVVMEQEVTELSQKQLFGDQFSVRDQHQVSAAAFEEAQGKLLLEALERQDAARQNSTRDPQ